MSSTAPCVREFLSTIKPWWTSVKTKLACWAAFLFPWSGPKTSPEQAGADDWALAFQPHPDADYEWVWKLAEQKFADMLAVFRGLDEKAESLMRHLGSGTGLITIGAISGTLSAKMPWWLLLLVIPAFAAGVLGMITAVIARMTVVGPTIPNLRDLIEYATATDGTRERFIGRWHTICVAMRPHIQLRARRVDAASWWFVVAVSLLSLPLVGAIAHAAATRS